MPCGGSGLLPSPPSSRRLHPNYSLNKLLNGNLRLFGGSDRLLLRTLASSSDRRYLLQHWPRPGTKDAAKRDLVAAAAGAQGDAPGSLEPLRQAVLTAPVAERRPHRLVAHGDVRVDDYYWLRDDDRSDPRVLAHLQARRAPRGTGVRARSVGRSRGSQPCTSMLPQ